MAWTEERVTELKKLWAEGHSASQIANQLGGVTRNAVIGKVHRLGLSGRATPSRPVKRPPRLTRATPQAPRVNTGVVAKAATPTAPAAPRAPSQPAASLKPMRLPNGDFVTVMNVKDTMCKWPIGDPTDPNFSFCGRSSSDGSPYCADHAKLAFQPVRKRERAPKEDGFARRMAG